MSCIHKAYDCLAQYAQSVDNTSEAYGYMITNPPSPSVHDGH